MSSSLSNSAPTPPRAVYRTRLERFEWEAARLERRSSIVSGLRLVTATAGLAFFVTAVATASTTPEPWIWALTGAVAVFMGLVVLHERVISRRDRWEARVEVQRLGLARLDRRWVDLPVPDLEPPASHKALARDLQLFGRASVAQLLGSTQSPPGRRTLRDWLTDPADPETVRVRQARVSALVPAIDFRHELAIEGQRLADLEPEVEPFLAWAEGKGWLASRRHWVWIAWILPGAAWASVVLAFVGVAPIGLPLGLFVLSFGLANLLAAPLGEQHERVAAREQEMAAYSAALSLLWSPEAEEIEGATLRELRIGLEASGRSAPDHLRSLQRLMDLADARRSGSLRFLLDTLFLWDVHTLWRLEKWRDRAGSRVREWLERLGELETLAGLAELAFQEPGWVFPRVDPKLDRIRAGDLGHPLLPGSQRVANDVEVGPEGTVLFVTGSNMSGKSTLLRALGVNVVLAQAGGPVCARAMALPPLDIATSVLVEDSLEAGISFFMAEVLRIRDVVSAAEGAAKRERRLLYLLDEILRGTNSADRRVAVREVLSRLLDLGAVGAVSTHDLALAEEPELAPVLVPVHFGEEVHVEAPPGQPPMTFDYVLRPGVAPTTNALRLLELFGLRARSSSRP